ncbi:MAG TPA: pyridoxamine 5'-phosphate oxidase family protein [Firmicutes bacterium]|nr:pyridoxamine 5'-phosphate oxidase family protein [Bacillota bacterium]
MSYERLTEFSCMEKILKENYYCTIALEEKPSPYLFAMNYGYEEKNLYFHSSPKGKKAGLFRHSRFLSFWIAKDVRLWGNPQNPCAMNMLYESLTGKAAVDIIEDNKQKTHALNLITAQATGSSGFEFSSERLDSVLILKATIIEITGKRSLN